MFAGASGNVVQGNFIGTDVTGSADLGNTIVGVEIEDAPSNTVGGSQAGARNVISGNDENGILIMLAGASENVVQGNYIGTDVTGSADLGNAFSGVEIQNAPNNTVGGSQAGARNIISGNDGAGIFIVDTGASGNVVRGNFIGTDVSGSVDLGNAFAGVTIRNAAINTVGGLQAGEGNVISGNDQSGIYIVDAGASGNLVRGTSIGTDLTGTADLGNTFSGLTIQDAPNNTVGGSQAGEGNIISGNDQNGVFIFDAQASGNVIQGNTIGTDVSGTIVLGNAFSGVKIRDNASGNIIGGIGTGESNVIAFNNTGGVLVGSSSTDTSTSNSIRGNSIFSNGLLGIDLGGDGVSPNDDLDDDTGPNNLQNFPIITYSTLGSTRIVGDLNSVPNEEFTLDFYSSSPIDGSNSDEGERYLGSATVMTDGSGDASFNVTLAEVANHGEFITATATDTSGNTSEFSQAVVFNNGTLESWRSDMFDDADLMDPAKKATVWGDSANPDGDRFANLIEYFMGFDPLMIDGEDAIGVLVDGGSLSLSYRKSKVAPAAVGQAEWSLNLLDWFSTDITEVVVEDLGAVEVIEATVPINEGENEKFMRLKVDSQ